MSEIVSTRDRILEFIRSRPYSPTVREIQDAVGVASPSTVQKHLDRLEADGQIGRGGPSGDRIYAIQAAQ